MLLTTFSWLYLGEHSWAVSWISEQCSSLEKGGVDTWGSCPPRALWPLLTSKGGMNPVGDLSLLLPPLAVISSVLSPGQICLKDLMWLCRKKNPKKQKGQSPTRT